MHQELDAHSLTGIGRHIHRLVNPLLRVVTLMEDRLQDRARGIRNVSILPVIHNGVSGAIPVPETEYAGTGGYSELLIEGAVSSRLGAVPAAACRCTVTARQC